MKNDQYQKGDEKTVVNRTMHQKAKKCSYTNKHFIENQRSLYLLILNRSLIFVEHLFLLKCLLISLHTQYLGIVLCMTYCLLREQKTTQRTSPLSLV